MKILMFVVRHMAKGTRDHIGKFSLLRYPEIVLTPRGSTGCLGYCMCFALEIMCLIRILGPLSALDCKKHTLASEIPIRARSRVQLSGMVALLEGGSACAVYVY